MYGRGRGRGRGFGTPNIGNTPVAGHTRSSGFANFLQLEGGGRRVRFDQPGQPNRLPGYLPTDEQPAEGEERGGRFDDASADGSEEYVGPMTREETNQLQMESEQYRADVEYYYNRRVTLYLERSGEGGDVVKQGLTSSARESLKKTLNTIQENHQKADDNFRLLRRSMFFTEEDVEQHEQWYGRVNEALVSLFDQLSEHEKSGNSATGNPLDSHSLEPTPIASSERYALPNIEPLKLDRYAGQPGGAYRAFKTRFKLVMKRSRVDEGLQAEHLLQSLDGEPLRIALMVDIESPEALKQMWESLDGSFGNKQTDYQHHVAELQKLASYPPCRSDSELKELYYLFSEHVFALRRISQNRTAGEDYKTILCGVLPDYLKRKVYKIMQDTPQDYTLDKVMTMVGKQVSLGNMESAFTKSSGRLTAVGSYGRESNPWMRSKTDAEKRAKACAGRLSEPQYIQPYTNEPPAYNMVTVGQDTFSIPGPVARACYPVARPSISHYAFDSHTVPPITQFADTLADQLIPQMAAANLGQGTGTANQHASQVNAAKSNRPMGTSAQTNQTVSLNLPSNKSLCVFCHSNHQSVDCRAFALGSQYVEYLKHNRRCYNCFSNTHRLETCPVESTCRAQNCIMTIKHSHFYCGHFKTQVRVTHVGLGAHSVDASGSFESSRLHTVLFLIENPDTGEELLARGFPDTGCTDTFILGKTAEKGQFPGLNRRVEFLLSAFSLDGVTRETVLTEGSLVKARLKSLDGRYRSPVITCITRDVLMQDVDAFQMSEQQRDEIKQGGYQLSDTAAMSSDKLPVDVVIGQDLYYQFIRGAPVHCSDGLVLVDTVFGYMLGGPVQKSTGIRKVQVRHIKCQPLDGLRKHIALDDTLYSNRQNKVGPEGCIPLHTTHSELLQEEPTVKLSTDIHRRHVNYLKCQLPEGIGKTITLDESLCSTRLQSVVPDRCIPSSGEKSEESAGEVCLFCGGSHDSVDCTLCGEQAMDVLRAQERCFNCFGTDHIIYFCPERSTCQRSDCKRRGKHSTFICRLSTAGNKLHHSRAANSFRLSVEEEQTSLKRLTDVETLGIKSDDPEESPVLERFKEEVRKDEEAKRVVIKLPWRHKRKKRLRSNFNHSLQRTINLSEKLKRPCNEKMREEYESIMEEQLRLGILEEVADIGTIAEVREQMEKDPYYYDHLLPCHEDSQICYIPHSGVSKPGKKLRVVYDASDKPYKGAFALNECLETGPKLIQSLGDILTRHRLKRYAYGADISKAFLNVVVDLCDRDSLRLLWIKGDRVLIYRFNRLPFGLTSSPFILAATLKFLMETSDLAPEEVEAVVRSFYVDDLVGSKDTEEEVIEEKRKVQEVLDGGSMELCKWITNSVTLKGLFAKEEEVVSGVKSVLGMMWDTDSDLIYVNSERILRNLGHRNTKAELYSVIAQVFDPMGLLSPYVLVAKTLLQKACLAKIDWKDKLPGNLEKEWECWKAELPKISEVQYERWVSFEGATDFELHGFCDASGEGLAACVYIVSKSRDKTQSRLLRCRTRVNSNKPMCMPRRELCATVLLSLVMHVVEEAVKDLNITKKTYYTDSMNALHWIVSDHFDWPPFVCNRIKQVRALTEADQWRYVNTVQNPADLPSRGCTIEELKNHTLFREGPEFLVTGEPQLLGKMDLSAMPEGCRRELPHVALVARAKEVEPKVNLRALISTSSTNSYYQLMKQTKLVYKYIYKLKAKVKGVAADPECWGIKRLEQDWFRTVQEEAFHAEITYCKAGQTSKESTRPQLVRSLSLYWCDESKLLRCSTRLQEAHLGYSSANPILIPKDDDFTTMLITATHLRVGHVGVKQTLSALRAEFWIPQARRLVKKVINRCIICRRVSAAPFDLPPPPPLPKCRVTMSRPFSNVGVDFCGPFRLKRQAKRYVAVFTCAATRAVHMEDLHDLSAESFLLCFKRFIGRRGVPELIISDNAKTFKCVAKRLKRLFDNPVLQRYFTERRVQWHFYVERAPWHGGFIETCVKLFKAVFKKLVGRSKLNSEEFRTLVVEAEQVINSRPLTYLYEDLKEGEPLTPSKLLQGYNLTDLPPIGRGGLSERLSITTRAKLLERLQNKFWEEWSETYLTELAERHSRQKVGNNEIREPREGEVVLLRGEPKMPRNRWKLGVVDKIHRSVKGNRIRSVIVRIPKGKGYDGGEFRRSPKHVVPLEAELD